MTTDFLVSDHGSIILLLPASEEGKSWAEEHIDPSAQHFGKSIAIERRYFRDIFDGIRADGLSIS